MEVNSLFYSKNESAENKDSYEYRMNNAVFLSGYSIQSNCSNVRNLSDVFVELNTCANTFEANYIIHI